MTQIEADSCGEAWLKYVSFVINQGSLFHDSGNKIIESDFATILINQFLKNDPIIEKFGDKKLINLYIDKLFKTEIISPFKFSYGQRIFDQDGYNQFNHLADILIKKKESKSASIGLLKAKESLGAIPCLISLSAKIRHNSLLLTSFFRSQNALRSYANFIALRKLQDKLAKRLYLPSGRLLIFAHCPHIYDEDVVKINGILEGTSSYV